MKIIKSGSMGQIPECVGIGSNLSFVGHGSTLLSRSSLNLSL